MHTVSSNIGYGRFFYDSHVMASSGGFSAVRHGLPFTIGNTASIEI